MQELKSRHRQWQIDYLPSPIDQTRLRFATSTRDHAAVEHWLVFANGRSEWIEKYPDLIDELALPANCGFLTWEHRGQGFSEGARSTVDHYDTYARDAGHIVKTVTGGKPYTLLAHSMGGLISLYATLTGEISPQAMVLASPLFRLPSAPIPRHLSQPLARLIRAVGAGHFGTGTGKHDRKSFRRNRLTHSYEAYQHIQASPCPISSATFTWIDATFQATGKIFQPSLLKGLATPILILGGGDERVVDPKGFTDWVQAASQHAKAHINYRLIHNARHELFSEIRAYRSQAIHEVQNWLQPYWPQANKNLG